MKGEICVILLAALVIEVVFSACPNKVRMPQCDFACIENRGSDVMNNCCKQNGHPVGACFDRRTVYCISGGDGTNCPPQRTPQCDITCSQSSIEMIQCCKANGFASGGCPNGKKEVYCTYF